MSDSPFTSGAAALVVLLAVGADASAELIHWSYNWSRSPAKVLADEPGTGYLELTDEPLRNVSGDSNIVAANLRTFSTAGQANPDRFTAKSYTLKLFLLDRASGKSGTLVFTGRLDGTLTAQSSHIKNTFTGKTTQTLVLGNLLFRATISSYAPPGPPESSNAGSIGARAEVSVQIVQHLPEPGTLTLACLGGAGLGLVRWRHRRGTPVPA